MRRYLYQYVFISILFKFIYLLHYLKNEKSATSYMSRSVEYLKVSTDLQFLPVKVIFIKPCLKHT